MNDLNFAGLIAARQAATQARQPGQTQDRNADPLDPGKAASAFDAAMARASRNESNRNAEAVAESRRARQPEPTRHGETKPQAPAPRETQGARNTMSERTSPQGEGDTVTPDSTKADASKPGQKTGKSSGDTQVAANAQDATAVGIPVMPVAPVQSIVETPATHDAAAVAGAAVAGAQAGIVASTQPIADEPDLESLSTVIRSDDPLTDSLSTPRGLARALPPEETPVARPAKSAGAPAHGAAGVAHAAPFERVIEASQREAAALREFSTVGRHAGVTAEAAATARVEVPGASIPMFTQTAATPATYSVAHGSVSTPVGQSAFAEEFAQRIVMFSSQKIHSAQIALTPAELGPISIGIEMRGQEAHLNFNAAHATTRAAIEDALPKLREMFANHGLQLANAHVGDQPAQRDYGRSRRGEQSELSSVGAAASSGGSNSAAAIDAQAIRTNWLRSDRLIDIVV